VEAVRLRIFIAEPVLQGVLHPDMPMIAAPRPLLPRLLVHMKSVLENRPNRAKDLLPRSFSHGLGMQLVAKSDQSTGNHHYASYALQASPTVLPPATATTTSPCPHRQPSNPPVLGMQVLVPEAAAGSLAPAEPLQCWQSVPTNGTLLSFPSSYSHSPALNLLNAVGGADVHSHSTLQPRHRQGGQ
jgi:hypothetical protein